MSADPGAVLRAVADGEPVDDDAAAFLRGLGLLTKRKGAWALTAQGRAQIPPRPAVAPMEDATREETAARLRPQPDSPNPTGVADA